MLWNDEDGDSDEKKKKKITLLLRLFVSLLSCPLLPRSNVDVVLSAFRVSQLMWFLTCQVNQIIACAVEDRPVLRLIRNVCVDSLHSKYYIRLFYISQSSRALCRLVCLLVILSSFVCTCE